MKLAISLLGGVFVCALLAAGPRQHPVPPGVREADRLPQPNDVPPVPPVRRGIDPAELKREADELAKLAFTLPAQIDHVTKGQLPKDLNQNLKRIEKLARHLRAEISP